MQDDERPPDLMDAGDGEIEEKVRKMMDPSVDLPDASSEEVKTSPTATAPEVVDMPVPKEPLKIKILHDETEDPVPPKKARASAKTKKQKVNKIAVTGVSGSAFSSPETEPETPQPEEELVEEEPETGIPDQEQQTETNEPQTAPLPEAEDEFVSDMPLGDEESEVPDTAEQDETKQTDSEHDVPVADQQPEEETAPKAPEFDDEQTVEAVDDILATESDKLLEAEDEKIAHAFIPPKKPGFGQKLRGAFSAWWGNPRLRWITLSTFVLAFLIAFIVPTSRYFMLNTARVRSGLSLQVLDNSTQQPLKSVKVSIGGDSGLTDAEGKVKLTKVKLGPSDLVVEKRAFAQISQKITVGFGSNPLGEIKLTPTGAQYSFTVTDYLSGKAVENVEASYRDASAVSDKDGKIKLTIDQPEDELEISFKGQQLREEKLKINANTKTQQPIKVVSNRKQVFISKRTGKYDIYKIDIDSKNEEKLLAGSGSERDDMMLIPHPSDEVVALVSTRADKRNKDDFLLSNLTLIDVKTGEKTDVAQSEQIRPLDWTADRLVYVQISQGASTANPKRHRLMSYDYKSGDNKELASSNYFNDAVLIGTMVYFAPSSTYQAGNGGLFKIDAGGNNKQTILSQEVWNLFRTSYEHLAISSDKQWYDYKLGDKTPTKLPGQPANIKSRVYVTSPDGKKNLWVDNRDGKGVLLNFDPSSQDEQTLRSQSGLKTPVRWLSDTTVIYRINTEQETADYAMSLNGGEPKKIRDVSNTGGVDRWYYY